MAKLVYLMLASLDGYAADERGEFGWARPDEEVHRFVNDLARPVGTHLYGRRMYEVMQAWESDDLTEGQPPVIREFAKIWRRAEKIVYSRTLEDASTRRTRIEREFDHEAVRRMKAEAERDISVSGPSLAAEASAPDSSTNASCSSRRSSWGVGRELYPRTSGSTSSSSPRDAFRTASYI